MGSDGEPGRIGFQGQDVSYETNFIFTNILNKKLTKFQKDVSNVRLI